MGQATADLPESAPKSDAASSSADELLSQLAGQEIDRLLADADAKGGVEADLPPPIVEELVLKDPSAPQPAPPVAAAAPPTAPLAEKSAPAAPAAPATDEAYAEQVDELFKQLKMTPGGAAAPIVPPDPIEESTSTAEKAALAPAAPVEEASVQQVLAQAEAVQRTPILVRALELLNSPFSFCPDEIRDTLGKVAILTLMNSIGVLLYVLLFRHR